jgi:hypothetical protein
MFMEPTFQYFQNSDKKTNSDISYLYLDLSLGLKKYFQKVKGINDRGYFSMAYSPGYNLGFKKSLNLNNGKIEIDAGHCLVIGVGKSFRRVNLETKFYTPRNLSKLYLFYYVWNTNLAIIARFKLK